MHVKIKMSTNLNYVMPRWMMRLGQVMKQRHAMLHSKINGGSAKLKSLVNRPSYSNREQKQS